MHRAAFAIILVALAAPAAADEVIVHARVLHVRDQPADSADVCARVEAGQRARLADEKDGWVRIEYQDGESRITGWVSTQWVTRFDPSSATPVGRKAIVTAERLNIRNGPSTQNPAIDFLDQGTEVLVLVAEDRWYKVAFGKEEPRAVGWLHVNFVKIAEPEASALPPPGQ